MLGERRSGDHSYKFPILLNVTLAHCVGRRATIGVNDFDNITRLKVRTLMYTIHQNRIENVETVLPYFHLISSQHQYTLSYRFVKQKTFFFYF